MHVCMAVDSKVAKRKEQEGDHRKYLKAGVAEGFGKVRKGFAVSA